MKRFSIFLLEAIKRSPERAAKLGEYLVKRENRRRENKRDTFQLPAWHKNTYTDNYEDPHDDKYFDKAWTSAHNYFRKRKKNIEKLPIKDLLKKNWQPVSFNRDYFLKHKIHDNKPINVARSRKTGNTEIINGYHRLAAKWLQGHTHIDANVQDVGYGKRKK